MILRRIHELKKKSRKKANGSVIWFHIRKNRMKKYVYNIHSNNYANPLAPCVNYVSLYKILLNRYNLVTLDSALDGMRYLVRAASEPDRSVTIRIQILADVQTVHQRVSVPVQSAEHLVDAGRPNRPSRLSVHRRRFLQARDPLQSTRHPKPTQYLIPVNGRSEFRF